MPSVIIWNKTRYEMNCCYVQEADTRLVPLFFVDEPILLDLVIPLPFTSKEVGLSFGVQVI